MAHVLRYVIGFPTPNPFLAREAMVVGVDKPGPDNTGAITSYGSRTQVSGNTTLSTPGNQSFTNYDFYGRVRVTSSGTKYFKNCRIFGDGSLTTATACVESWDSNVTDVVIEDSDLIPSTPSAYLDGVVGHHFTLKRCKIQHCVDPIGVFNSANPTGATGVLVELCYMDNNAWFYPAPGQSDGSHNDGVQLQGGSGTIIRGNYVHAYNDPSVGTSPWTRNPGDSLRRSLSCIMITPNVGAITNIVVNDNWFSGGEIAVNAGKDTNAGNFVGTFTDNRFGDAAGDDTYYATHALDFDAGCTFTATTNVYDADESAVTVRTNA